MNKLLDRQLAVWEIDLVSGVAGGLVGWLGYLAYEELAAKRQVAAALVGAVWGWRPDGRGFAGRAAT